MAQWISAKTTTARLWRKQLDVAGKASQSRLSGESGIGSAQHDSTTVADAIHVVSDHDSGGAGDGHRAAVASERVARRVIVGRAVRASVWL